MKAFNFLASLIVSFLCPLWIFGTNAEPVQFCKFDSPDRPGEEINFCMGALQFQNVSTNSHDMYLTITVHRHQASALGWTAIGAGSVMKGSLMFIIYGDPLSHEDPIISIRTVEGHHQPTLLTKSDMPKGMDIRVIRSSWLLHEGQDYNPSPASYTAIVSLVCYSCNKWLGTDISANSKSQPWIWAWNANQKFDVFSFDAHLLMHRHHPGAGGWGNFFLDMSRSINTARYPPSLPPIRPKVATLGSSDSPLSFSNSVVNLVRGPGSFVHGLVLAAAFLLLFPAGIIGLRVGTPKSFAYHWIIQLCASVFFLLGLGLGFLKGRRINTLHQCVGIALVFCIGLQGIFGWWHHRRFVRLPRRTWVSHVHIWLGRLIMIAGWENLVSGLLLRGYTKDSAITVIVTAVVCLQAVGLTGWLFWVQNKRAKYTPKPMWATAEANDAFALSTSDDEDDGDEEKEKEKEKEERRSSSGRNSLSLSS